MFEVQDAEIARRVEPPKALPTPENVESEAVSYFAESTMSGGLSDERKVFGVLRADRRRHMYVLGKTGVGKTKLLEHLIRADIYYGHGVCVVDPNGDLVDDILEFIPQERAADVVCIDPTNEQFPISWNPLQHVARSEQHHVVSGIVEVFSRLFGTGWNPRAEHLLRFALLALLRHPRANLTLLLTFLSSETFRKEVTDLLDEGIVKRFWVEEFSTWKSSSDRKAISTLINTLTGFLAHPAIYAIFSGTENRIDLRRCIEEQKILLVSVPKGVLGDHNSTIFGSLFMTFFKQAVLSRSKTPPAERQTYYLYVDEFHHVATESFLSLLSEGGRYGLCICVSNQHLGQLSTPLKHAVLGNIATLVVFQISADDATALEKEFAPLVDARDMINLPVREFYIKLSINGCRYDPFSATTLPVEPAKWNSARQTILKLNRDRFCRRTSGSPQAASSAPPQPQASQQPPREPRPDRHERLDRQERQDRHERQDRAPQPQRSAESRVPSKDPGQGRHPERGTDEAPDEIRLPHISRGNGPEMRGPKPPHSLDTPRGERGNALETPRGVSPQGSLSRETVAETQSEVVHTPPAIPVAPPPPTSQIAKETSNSIAPPVAHPTTPPVPPARPERSQSSLLPPTPPRPPGRNEG